MTAPLPPAATKGLWACTRCHSVTKPATARRAWWMFGICVVWVALAANEAASGRAGGAEHPVLGLLILGALLHPRVCRACQSHHLVPLDSPVGRRVLEGIGGA